MPYILVPRYTFLWSLKKLDLEHRIPAKPNETANKHTATDTKGTK